MTSPEVLIFYSLFSDGTSVFIEGTHYNKVINIVNNELDRINTWLRSNKLTINIKKTHYMIFHHTRIKQKLCIITICGINVLYTKNTKFIGVIIDNKLRCSDHINYIKICIFILNALFNCHALYFFFSLCLYCILYHFYYPVYSFVNLNKSYFQKNALT